MPHLGELDRGALSTGNLFVREALESPGDDVAKLGIEGKQTLDDGIDEGHRQETTKGAVRRI